MKDRTLDVVFYAFYIFYSTFFMLFLSSFTVTFHSYHMDSDLKLQLEDFLACRPRPAEISVTTEYDKAIIPSVV